MNEAAKKIEPREKLYITDDELFDRMGVPAKVARPVVAMMDRDRKNGFPQKQALWGNRRYWPAVKAWLDRNNGLKMDTPRRGVSDE